MNKFPAAAVDLRTPNGFTVGFASPESKRNSLHKAQEEEFSSCGRINHTLPLVNKLPTAAVDLRTPNGFTVGFASPESKRNSLHKGGCFFLAQEEGLEPPWACAQTVFKTAAL